MVFTWETPNSSGSFPFTSNGLYEFQFYSKADNGLSYFFSEHLNDQNYYGSSVYNENSPSLVFTNLDLYTEYTAKVRTIGVYGLSSDWVELNAFTAKPQLRTISNCIELQSIGSGELSLVDNYKLTQNIDCSDSVNWNWDEDYQINKGFDPIGDDENVFKGSFNGQGYSISNVYINRTNEDYIGLFAYISEDTEIKNLKLINFDIRGDYYVGTLAGSVNGDVSDLESEGSITGNNYVGGVAGEIYGSSILNTVVEVDITGQRRVGGISGIGSELNLENAQVSGNIQNRTDNPFRNIGGLFGSLSDSYISNSSSNISITANIDASDIYYIGGLIGYSEYGVQLDAVSSKGIIDIEIKAESSRVSEVGGLVGYLCEDDNGCNVTKSYSETDINISSQDFYEDESIEVYNIGGLIGRTDNLDIGYIKENYSNNIININIINGYDWGSIHSIGGFIGKVDYGVYDDTYISNNYSRTPIEINTPNLDISNIGGFIGENNAEGNLIINKNYSTGNISINNSNDYPLKIGGFIGLDNGDGLESNTLFADNFSTSSISISSQFDFDENGGFDGYTNNSENNFQNNYFLSNGSFTACFNTFIEFQENACMPKNDLAYFKNIENQPLASWDFNSIWDIQSNVNDGFPALRMLATDTDLDGIADTEENGAPNKGDGNLDGIKDREQSNVAGALNQVTNKYTVLEVNDTCSIKVLETMSEDSNEVKDSGFMYPVGLVNFKIECDVGFTANVALYEYGTTDTSLSLRKYKDNGYFEVPNFSIERISGFDGVKVTYSLKDGGLLDIDGIENGVIIDPVGLGQLDVGVPNTGFGQKIW